MQAGALGAKQRMEAAAGAGFANTILTSPQGVQNNPSGPGFTAKQTLGG